MNVGWSLRARIVCGAFLASALPLVAAAWLVPEWIRKRLDDDAAATLQAHATSLAEAAQQQLESRIVLVRALAKLDCVTTTVVRRHAGLLTAFELAAVNTQLARVAQAVGRETEGIWLCDVGGTIFAGAMPDGSTQAYANLDVQDRPYLEEARRSAEPVISPAMRSRVQTGAIIVVCTPILGDDGAFLGLVGLSLSVDALATNIAAHRLGRTGYPFAIDRDGIVVAHPDPQRVLNLDFRRVAGAEHLASAMLAGTTGTVRYTNSRGEGRIAAFAPVPIAGWSIATTIGWTEFRAGSAWMRTLLLSCLGAVCVAVTLTTLALTAGLQRARVEPAEASSAEPYSI